jgi:photosystem II stability/assembly factor-like uncharacterized protein
MARHRILIRLAAAVVGVACVVLSAAPAPVSQTSASPTPPNAVTVPSTWVVLYSNNFADGTADGWGVSLLDDQAVGWSIQTDSGNYVFVGQGNSLASLMSGRWSDFSYKVQVKLSEGYLTLEYRVGECAGYYIGLQATGVDLGRSPTCAPPANLVHVAGSYDPAQWYTVEIVGIGGHLQVSVNGALQIDFTDSNPIPFGSIGMQTQPGAVAEVASIEVMGPPEPPQPVWKKTGGPLGGVGYDVRMRPDDPDRLFATDTFSGVNMSADGGQTWSASNKGITARMGVSNDPDAIPIFCLTIDPHNPDIVWVGTQGTRTVFKSVDGGQTWAEKANGIAEPAQSTFRGFTVDPRSSDIVYAGGEGPPLGVGKSTTIAAGMLYRTTDGGESWQVIWRGDAVARYIMINPQNPDVIYVSTGIMDREAVNSNAAQNFAGGVGILKSVDGGSTWRALNQSNGLQNLYISSLHMNPQNPNILLAGAGHYAYSDGSGVYLSTDGGEHWQLAQLATQLGQSADPVAAVKFSTADPSVAYAGSETTFWRSADGGQTWKVMSGGTGQQLYYGPPGINIGRPIDIQPDPRDPNRVFVNNYGGGNFLTVDGGRTWTPASRGYTGAQVWMIAVDPGDPRRVFTNAQEGPFRSGDGGSDWSGIRFPPIMLDVQGGLALDPADSSRVLLGDSNTGEIYLSRDSGQSWILAFQEPKLVNAFATLPIDQCDGFRAFAFASSNPNTAYAGMRRTILSIDSRDPGTSYGVYKSLDGGATWQASNDAVSALQDINALVVDPRSADVVYAATIASGVLRSRDGGKSWVEANQGLPTVDQNNQGQPLLDVRSLILDPNNPSTLYAGLEIGAVYKTTDGGDHWAASGYGLDAQASIRALAIDPTNSKLLYAGDLLTGAYRSQDAGQTWEQINDGLRTRSVMALAVSADGGTVYAATNGEGVFRLDLKPLDRGIHRAVPPRPKK